MIALIEHDMQNPMITALGGATIEVEIDEDTLTLGGTATLASFAGGLPIGPGDVVRVDNAGVVQEVVALKPQWIFEVVLNQPKTLVAPNAANPSSWSLEALDDDEWALAELAADELQRQLETLCALDRGTTYSLTLATASRAWFDAWLSTSTGVWYYEVLRTPEVERVDLAHELLTYGLTHREAHEVVR